MVKVFWFRKDLRLEDNRALYHFIKEIRPDEKYIFLYIKNKNTYNFYGQKRIAFLYESLRELQILLEVKKYNLYIFKGNSIDCFKSIISQFGTIEVYSNQQIEPYAIKRDKNVQLYLESKKSVLKLYSDTTLFEPGEVLKEDKTPYTVFTPFSKKCHLMLNNSHFSPTECDFIKLNPENNVKLSDSYDFSEEYAKLEKSPLIRGGRKEGSRLLSDFIKSGITDYKAKRDFPGITGTSLLSAHLHFGTISIREAYSAALIKSENAKEKDGINTWINELLWREFYYNITFHFPNVLKNSFKEKFDAIKWAANTSLFDAWREGKTGYPIVDAGMRQLIDEGWMHNRVRMITAMFLTKDLFIDWRLGEKHFAEHLIDLDFSSNNGGWQWSASTGCDAQPYFRIFNPYLQSRKFDAGGDYIRKYVKELKNIPSKYIHKPDDMTASEQSECRVVIGKDYPRPIVEHHIAKEYAIMQFAKISKENTE
jgi:deoxyribodipyrimidine photo-lyase